MNRMLTFGAVCALSFSFLGCDVLDDDDGFVIRSASVDSGAALPTDFSCEAKNFGDGISPELHWSGAPEGTKSFAITFKDLSLVEIAPAVAFHSGIWDIPSSVSSIDEGLPEGAPTGDLTGASQLNAGPAGTQVYLGPCPSWASACPTAPARSNDTYAFTIYALDVEQVTLPAVGEGENAIGVYDAYFASMAIGSAELKVTSDAAPASLDEGFLALCPVDELAE